MARRTSQTGPIPHCIKSHRMFHVIEGCAPGPFRVFVYPRLRTLRPPKISTCHSPQFHPSSSFLALPTVIDTLHPFLK